jgi:hypothetical protein
MELNEKIKAIHFIRPKAEFVIRDNELDWLDTKQEKPTETEIENGWIALKAELAANEAAAQAKRQAALAKLEALGLDEDDLKALGL